ncbi:NADPH dehydrogenase NamA [Paenibacillus phoenicis]|uniref:NADPH dehydrogenase NamA n=1 Tax=Paenibacillus phoenicis TaxID=554117 RepID=A0ABU5PIE6_9BACL|nr:MULTISPECIES: NADPH dehydrogenase NamA [Paenibacillus]EES75244.1 NADPH dehydrogenase [Paenibacillus sp. oral taxon 786 str. D14]MCT2193960.1 NADPH dehydrogenase NamA [Paenibacillus sp. p3-SID1389]MEA3569452.1 NADPH dehydrogenase NamA [Paenibacillus phoenicis]
MSAQLFTPYTIKQVTFKNRIVMSPMCQYSSHNRDGKVEDWHRVHYASRAVGGVGLILVEATAVLPEGRISYRDLGIWSDEHISGLKELVDLVHRNGAKIGIQLAHAGRKAELEETILAPSAIPFPEKKTPKAADAEDIRRIVEGFRDGARRAKEAGFDVIEIHGAHGYLLNEFLSPVTNHREDEYGGNADNRYRLLSEVIEAVNSVWSGPLFVRISANEYDPQGNSLEQYINYARRMKAQGVDLIDCSSGGLVPAQIQTFPGYQVNLAEQIRRQAEVATGAVGLITDPSHAEEILGNGRADLVLLGRELLRNPYWAYEAAKALNTTLERPVQYQRA